MMKYARLETQAIMELMAALEGWDLEADHMAIGRQFRFDSFAEAFGFMTECALAAERLNHHPEWSNVYSQVHVRLTTHAVKGLTELDFKLAGAMDRAAARRN